jgi:hypothetical protein
MISEYSNLLCCFLKINKMKGRVGMAEEYYPVTLTTVVKELFPGGRVATIPNGTFSATGNANVSNIYAIIYCGNNLSTAPIIAQGFLDPNYLSYNNATIGKKIFVQAALLNGPSSGQFTVDLQY